MSASEKAVETAQEVVADIAEEVAEQAIDFAEFARQMSKVKIQYGLLGVAIGATAGALAGFVIAYRKAETKYSQIADAEVAEMREHYRAKGVALEAEYAKKPVEEIVKDRGYSSPDARTHIRPPMAVQPPADVAEDEKVEKDEPKTKNIFEEAQVTHEWDWHEERRKRSPDIPYVIHQDELHEMEYTEATLTYYEGDDVLCTDRDEPLDEADRERLIGEANLNRFGHGSGDASVVYVRNDQLELVYEVVKSPNHFAEEVHGFSHESYDRGNLERMRARERDDPEA